MDNKMKICCICKTPIQEGIEIEVNGKLVHPGHCHCMLNEVNSKLNESEQSTDDIQMIM